LSPSFPRLGFLRSHRSPSCFSPAAAGSLSSFRPRRRGEIGMMLVTLIRFPSELSFQAFSFVSPVNPPHFFFPFFPARSVFPMGSGFTSFRLSESTPTRDVCGLFMSCRFEIPSYRGIPCEVYTWSLARILKTLEPSLFPVLFPLLLQRLAGGDFRQGDSRTSPCSFTEKFLLIFFRRVPALV